MNNVLLYIIIALLIVIMAYLIWDRQRSKKPANDPTQQNQQPVNNQNTVNTVTTPKQETNNVSPAPYSNTAATTTQTVQTQTQNPVRGNIVISETEPVKSLKEASILVVEDDVDLRQYLKEELSGEVKEVLMAGDGIEAVDILQSKTVHIVVSDVMMPRMDGFSLCKYIKTTIEISHTPVILLTARTDDNSRILGYKKGADDYITKPFNIEFLINSINNLFNSRELVRQRYFVEGQMPRHQETTFSSADENFMKKFEALVSSNISNADMDTPFLIEAMGMSRTVLYSKIKMLTGMNIQNYINKARMDHVIALMRNTELSFAEIAEQSGFNSARYFSTSFKNYTGYTPSEYRKKLLSGEQIEPVENMKGEAEKAEE